MPANISLSVLRRRARLMKIKYDALLRLKRDVEQLSRDLEAARRLRRTPGRRR